MKEHFQKLDLIRDAATRMETGQLTQSFVTNMLKDLIRANYTEYLSLDDKDGYCLVLIELGFKQMFGQGQNDNRIWKSVQTSFGVQRTLTKLGNFINNVYRLWSDYAEGEIAVVIADARKKVG